MKDIEKFVVNNKINSRNQSFLEDLSKKHNCDFLLVKNFFQSKIVVIKPDNTNVFFEDVEKYLFDIKKQYDMILEGLEKGVLIVKNYQGLQDFLEIISRFEVEIFQKGDYLIASTNGEYFSKYLGNIVNRNEFSEDILIYAETEEKNLTLTNAFSFLNIEVKTFSSINQLPQFFMQMIGIPLESEIPENFYVFSNQLTKDFFYQYFEVISSVDEWQTIYDLLDAISIYGFFYQIDKQWLIGFKAHDNYYQYESFRNQIKTWGITDKETVKPYTNDYYISVLDDLFLISNFQPIKTSQENNANGLNNVLFDLKEKIGNRDVFEVGYEFNDDLGMKIYFFSTFDDKIKKEVIRIF